MYDTLFNARQELLRFCLSEIRRRQAACFSRSRVGFGEECNQSAITELRVGVAKLEFAPLWKAVRLPAFLVARQRQDVGPADWFLAPTNGLSHRSPHCNYDGREHQVVRRSDQILSRLSARILVAEPDKRRRGGAGTM